MSNLNIQQVPRRAPVDLHTEVAARVLGIPPEEVTPMQRECGKALTFWALYGGVTHVGGGVKEEPLEPKPMPFPAKWTYGGSKPIPPAVVVHGTVFR